MSEELEGALGLYYTISPLNIGSLVPSFAVGPPQGPDEDEWAFDERGKRFFSQTTPVQGFSDGIKAFTGIVSMVISSDYRVILIDEPEAFLHPPLVRRLGKRLTDLAAERRGNIFASTHSPDFIMGCVQSGKRVNIVRLTYKKGVATARILRADDLSAMMRDPLLRSTGVLSALFHEGVVVCEGDVDRAFYQEINERLLAGNQGGSADTLFLNAQNKSTVRRIIRPLREMGIPAAAIVDIDILNNRPDFTYLLQAAAVPKDLQLGWGQVKGQLYPKIKSAGKNIANLDHASRETAEKLFNDLAEYGIYVVPLGEVEDWLTTLSVVREKKEWLPRIFERMGTDPADENYVKPAEGDVWEFIRKLAMWITNPSRKGIPS